jgi:fatty-acyl-CoA synthase
MALRFPKPASAAYRFPLTIGHLLDASREVANDQLIVYRDQVTMTYRELYGRIGRLASALAALNACEGTTIAVMDWDSHRYMEAFFAVPMMGAVLQTVNVRLPIEQIAFTLRDAQAEIAIVHRDFLPLLDHVRTAVPTLKTVIVALDGAGVELPRGAAGEYEAILEQSTPDFAFRDFDENAIATTFYTSGTTGNPKGVCFTHRQIVLHALAGATALGTAPAEQSLRRGDVYMPLTPMFHVHAWGLPYVATMLGLKQIYPGRYEPEMLCRLRTEHVVTFSHCVPTVLQMILQAADATATDLSGWKMIIGGSALTGTLFLEGRRRGINLFSGYGMSETCPTISIARRRREAEDDDGSDVASLTCAGLPIPLVTAEIVDSDMNPVPHDGRTKGELVLRAPWLTPCYVGNEEASEALWQGGWLHTQDFASIDPDGFIHIRDRLKDVIKSGGEWIDSQQLEDILAGVEGVAELVVIAIADERWGERPLAVVVPNAGASPGVEELNAPILAAIHRGEITKYARLERVQVVNVLPRTSVGKIDKKLLREQYGEDASGPTLAF